jgi:hypothetical protein
VSGELVEGTYSGPESVLLFDRTGSWVPSAIVSHEILLPKNWPVVPGDGSTLVLQIALPSPMFELDPAQAVIGQGSLSRNDNRVDISTSLSDPGFWAVHMWLHAESDILPDPPSAWGLSKEDANQEYERLFERHWKAGVWPFVRLLVDGSRYVEIEYAAGIEHQNRVWIGGGGGRRVLMGYHSGHFSFPSFRITEVLALANRIGAHPSAPLLLLPGAYMEAGEILSTETVTRWLTQMPGIRMEFIPLVLPPLLENSVPDLHWKMDERLGWINNWQYSQRNPQSPMSILTTDDFIFIHEFLGS